MERRIWVRSACCSARTALREFLAEGVQDPVELGADGVGAGLVVDAVQQSLDPAPRGLGRDGHQVGRECGAAPLPGRSRQRRADRLGQAAVGAGGHERDAGKAAGGQVAEEEGQLPGAALGLCVLRLFLPVTLPGCYGSWKWRNSPSPQEETRCHHG